MYSFILYLRCILIVIPPVILSIDASQSRLLLTSETTDDEIHLSCEAVGTPVISITWYFLDYRGLVTVLESQTRREGYNVFSSMTINVSVRNHGNYTCSATNDRGTTNSTINLSINGT